MERFIKTAITVPGEQYRRVESIRKRKGLSRSEVFAMALDAFFKALDRKEMEEKYVRGYQRHPEQPAELGPWIARGIQGAGQEQW